MPATLQDFRETFPELAAMTDDAVQRNIDLAEQIHDINPTCTLYLTAHLLTVDISGDNPGEVKGETIGPKSADYMTQAASGDEAFYTRTEYGRRFLTLERRVLSGPFRVRVF